MKGIRGKRVTIFWGGIVILGVMALLSMTVFSNYTSGIIGQSANLFTKTFSLDLTPLSTTALVRPITCTVTNQFWYYDNSGNKYLYSEVPKTQFAFSLAKYQGDAGSLISGADTIVTAACDPIPSSVQNIDPRYQGVYITGGQVKDTFCITTNNCDTGGKTINDETVNLPNNGLLAPNPRVDGQGAVILYKKHFTTDQIQNAWGQSADMNLMLDNHILYNLKFAIEDSSGNNPTGYTWQTSTWGNDVGMKVWLSNNNVKTPPTNIQSISKVENIKWVSPQNACNNGGNCIDEGQQDVAKRTITVSVVLPQFTLNEGFPSVNLYYTDAVGNPPIVNTMPVSVLQLSNPTISTDGTNTATFTGTFVIDQFANTGTWKIVLKSATDSAGNAKRSDSSNVELIYFSVINSAKKGGDIVCTSGQLQTDSQGNQYCAAAPKPQVQCSDGSFVTDKASCPAPKTGGDSSSGGSGGSGGNGGNGGGAGGNSVCTSLQIQAGWTQQTFLGLPTCAPSTSNVNLTGLNQLMQPPMVYLVAIIIIAIVLAIGLGGAQHPRETITEWK